MHMHVRMYVPSLVPRPPPGISTPIRLQLRHCHVTSLPQELHVHVTPLVYTCVSQMQIAHAIMLTNQIPALPTTCAAIQTNQVQALHGLVGMQ